MVIYLFDSSSAVTELERIQIEIEKIKNKHPLKPLIVLANKVDKLTQEDKKLLEHALDNVLLLSAKSSQGVDDLIAKLLDLINTGALRNDETIVTNTRHYDALLKALEEIQKVKYGLESGLSGDLMAIDIRQALYHFGEITGEITNDDLLGNIFANFCIGK